MMKSKYDYEKAIFDDDASLNYLNANRRFLLFFKSELDLLKSKTNRLKILDVGCGAGGKAKTLAKMFPNFKFYACDISKSVINKAKKDPSNVRFTVADAQKLPYQPKYFDVVIMNSVLDHTENPKNTTKEAYRVLKKKGSFLITSPLEMEPTTIHGQLTRFKSFRKHRKERCGHLHAFSRKSLIKLLTSSGFIVEKINFDWFFLTQVIDLIYYPLLALTGKGPGVTINSYIRERKSLTSSMLKKIRNIITFIQNLESSLTYQIPLGWFAYIRAKK